MCESEPDINVKLRDFRSFFVADNIREVTLQKSLSGLGFSFLVSELGPDEGSMVHIKSLSSGQPAGDCGHLKEGDIILAVNGEPVRGLSYEVKDALFISSIPRLDTSKHYERHIALKDLCMYNVHNCSIIHFRFMTT